MLLCVVVECAERDLNHQLAAYFVADKISVDIPYSPVRRKEDPRFRFVVTHLPLLLKGCPVYV